MDKTTFLWTVLVVSETVAFVLIYYIWMSDDALAMKVALAVLALVPLVGTLGALWIYNFPSPQPESLRNKYRLAHDVHERWRGAFEEKDEKRKKRRIRSLIEKGYDDQGRP